MSEIKAGDTVQLKSGGPVMTVEEVQEFHEGKPCATCSWFDNNKFFSEKFMVTSLKHFDRNQSSEFFS